MNRKIFTLLAGAFLMLAMVFSVSAQPAGTTVHFSKQLPLKLGPEVTKLNAGANDYYHLKVTGVSLGTGLANLINVQSYVNTLSPGTELVLYMGNRLTTTRQYPIFIAPLGKAGQTGFWELGTSGLTDGPWYTKDAPKSQESASSLWCTVVNPYELGQNPTFDFTNKFIRNQLLEVDITDYEIWGTLGSDVRHTNFKTNGALFTPGGISGWHFSDKYATGVDVNKPLFSYITEDTVAVLCVDIDGLIANAGSNVNIGAYVFVKIAAANDVRLGLVPGVVHFTLHEAAPFVLDALDINTMFGTEDWGVQTLTFDPNVNPTTGTNPLRNLFTEGVFAQHIGISTVAGGDLNFNVPAALQTAYTLPATIKPIYTITSNTGPLSNPQGVYDNFYKPIDWGGQHIYPIGSGGAPNNFDELGYLYLRTSNSTSVDDNYIYARNQYYSGNAGGDRYLTFGTRALQTADNDLEDLFLYGQSIWRLVYYPSGDSIYINSFQATYLPSWDPDLCKTSATNGTLALRDQPIAWTSVLAQSSDYYTYRATPYSLDASTASDVMEQRMKRGKDPYYNDPAVPTSGAPDFFTYYHRNYVTIQNLTGNVRIVTLGNGSFAADHTIDTHIFFDVYDPCKVGKTDRTTIASDLYLIRSKIGNVVYYLNIPLFSAMDSASWTAIEPDVHPELLPSYQWVVLKRYENSTTSQITVRNREFDGTKFEIQLYKTDINDITTYMSKFDIIIPTTKFLWNNKAVNSGATTFDADDGKSTFIALPSRIKKDAKLGYTYISREEAQVNVYALNFAHGIDQNRYVDWKGDFWKFPNTDTTVYVTGQGSFDRLYFTLDTVKYYGEEIEKYGFKPSNYAYKITDLVQLERQPYYLNFEDPYKLICDNMYNMVNASQGEYAMSNRESLNSKIIGKPFFNLRNTYHKTIDGKLVPYFVLAQRLDVRDFDNKPSEQVKFREWLNDNYNSIIASEINDKITKTLLGVDGQKHTNNDYFKTGVFVARVDDQTAKLKAQVRADEAQILSTFRLVPDDDPIYRRFNTLLEADVANDAPKTLDFFWMDRPSYKLFENTGLWPGQREYWANYGIGTVKTLGKKNYLGSVNINQYPDAATAIYVDTAFINRGTGPVKPQYLLVVDPTWPDPTQICDPDTYITTDVYENYLRGRFLINATDSARGIGAGANWNTYAVWSTASGVEIPELDGRNYLWDMNWERLVFTDAIHSYDYDALYLVEGINLAPYMYPSSDVIDISLLNAASAPYDKPTSATKPIRKIFLGNNYHKDAVFQMRLIERGAKQFIIESETGHPDSIQGKPGTTGYVNNARIWGTSYGQKNSNGPMIAPCAGGWIKDQNGPGVISRSDVVYNIANGLKMDVKKTEKWATQNDAIAAVAPTVIGGNNAVTILGAAGKKVVISNILGQTVAGTVLTSDNATLATPKGVVVVAIEGETAVKTLVK